MSRDDRRTDREMEGIKVSMRTKEKGDLTERRRGECPCWPLYCMALFVFYMLYRSLPPPSTLRPLSQLLTHPNNPLFISSRAEARQTTQRRRPGEIINRTQTHSHTIWLVGYVVPVSPPPMCSVHVCLLYVFTHHRLGKRAVLGVVAVCVMIHYFHIFRVHCLIVHSDLAHMCCLLILSP